MTARTTMSLLFFFNDTATTEIYTLSLHDALPICKCRIGARPRHIRRGAIRRRDGALQQPQINSQLRSMMGAVQEDRKSTRLNSSHSQISYAVFCLKKKKRHSRSASLRLAPTASHT